MFRFPLQTCVFNTRDPGRVFVDGGPVQGNVGAVPHSSTGGERVGCHYCARVLRTPSNSCNFRFLWSTNKAKKKQGKIPLE